MDCATVRECMKELVREAEALLIRKAGGYKLRKPTKTTRTRALQIETAYLPDWIASAPHEGEDCADWRAAEGAPDAIEIMLPAWATVSPGRETAPAPEASAASSPRVSEHPDRSPAAARAGRAYQAPLDGSGGEALLSKGGEPAPIPCLVTPAIAAAAIRSAEPQRSVPMRPAAAPLRALRSLPRKGGEATPEEIAAFLERKRLDAVPRAPTAFACDSDHYRAPSAEDAEAMRQHHDAQNAAAVRPGDAARRARGYQRGIGR